MKTKQIVAMVLILLSIPAMAFVSFVAKNEIGKNEPTTVIAETIKTEKEAETVITTEETTVTETETMVEETESTTKVPTQTNVSASNVAKKSTSSNTTSTIAKETTTKIELLPSFEFKLTAPEKSASTGGIVYYDVPISDEDQEFIAMVCEYYDFEPVLVYQIMKVESDYNPNCVSSTNDHGIMQLNARWYKEYLNQQDDMSVYLEDFDIYDIRQNVIVALRELCYWRDICANKGYYGVKSMLESYNKGFNYFKNPDYTPYANKVLAVNIKER